MYKYQKLDSCIWIKSSGKTIPIYNGLTKIESKEVSIHYKMIQSMVDTYPKKFLIGKNYQIIDGWIYYFDIIEYDRKISLIERERIDINEY